MLRATLTLLAFASLAPALRAAESPRPRTLAQAYADAETHSRTLAPVRAPYTRYLTLYAVPETDRDSWVKALTFHLWSLSKEAEPPQLGRVPGNPDLLHFNLRDFGIDPFVYGRLSTVDPYAHVQLSKDGKAADVTAYAPWLGDPQVVKALADRLGGSTTAVLRGDWFFVQTSIQDGRGKVGKGTGYYDFLGVANRAEFFKLAGVDEKLAEQRKAEWRAIVKRSGVARFPRQVERLGAIDSGAWYTLDVLDDSKGPRNAIRQLDKDYKHQAEEHYAVGPSGLFVFLLCDEKGNLQDSAPDKIGPDKTRPDAYSDTRIEICMSCVRCHVEGLRPIDSWVRNTLKDPLTAELPPEKAVRINQLYFRDLSKKLRLDNLAYADRLKECNGLTPRENAEVYGRLWDQYGKADLALADAARECGTSPERLRQVLAAVASQKKLDPVLADLLELDGTIRRDSWEEVFPVVMTYFGGKP